MTEAEKKASEIYGLIRSTSADRPYAFDTLDQMLKVVGVWTAENTALKELRRAEPDVLLAFLDHSFEWLTAEVRIEKNFQVILTFGEAIGLALDKAPEPLNAELVCRLLREYRQQVSSMARMYFPFWRLLELLTVDHVTEEMRSELEKLAPYFAPSPTGKSDETTQQTRERIAGLTYVAGKRPPDAGRGPWSQAVFDELK